MALTSLPAPSPLHDHLLQLQWVSAGLKSLELATNRDGSPLNMKHPLVLSLVENLSSSSVSVVKSTCVVLTTACIRHGWLAHQQLLSSLVTQVAIVPFYAPVLTAVTRLLLQEMTAILESCSVYICPYSLRTNVHPFISILNSRLDTGQAVMEQILQILTVSEASCSSVQLLEPVIKYLLLHPSPAPPLSSLGTQLHSDLIHLATAHVDTSSHLIDLLIRILPLQPTNGSDQLHSVVACVHRLIPFFSTLTPPTRDGLVDFCFVLLIELTKRGLSISRLVASVVRLLKDNTECVRDHHVLGIGWLLYRHLFSPQSISALLSLGSRLCECVPLTYHISAILLFPLVQLLSQPNSVLVLLNYQELLSANQMAAKSLLNQIRESCVPRNRCSKLPMTSTSYVGGEISGTLSTIHSCLHSYLCIHLDPVLGQIWLEGMISRIEHDEMCAEYLTLLAAALGVCFTDKTNILKSVFRAFGSLTRVLPSLASSVLTFLLHLECSIPDPGSKLMLFYSIPNLSTHLTVGVVNTIRVLGNNLSLLALATRLIGKAWQQQDQIYSQVREFLTCPLPSPPLLAEELREIEIARAAVIKDICSERAEQHGEDMLSFISRTLTLGFWDAIQVTMVLEGVVSLCLHEVVDVVTVWEVLGKGGKLFADKRPAVMVALSSLFGLADEVNHEASHSHKTFRSTSLKYLWNNAFSLNAAVSSAALDTLANFKIEDFFSDQIPTHVYSVLPKHNSHDQDSVQPLVGSQCVHMVHYIPHGALNAYSAFLASLLKMEVEGLPRGVVYSAMKEATTVTPHEVGLQTRVTSLRGKQYCLTELSDGYVKYCALNTVGRPKSNVEGSPEYSGVQSSAIWKRELRSVLDKSVATLKALFKNSTGLFLELEGVSLWEGLACLYSSKQWVVMEEVCQMFYEVRLTAVKYAGEPDYLQRCQAHNWAVKKSLKTLEASVRENPMSAPCIFMAAVGVAMFVPVQSDKESDSVLVLESLLSDLMNGSIEQLGDHTHETREDHVTYTHDIIGVIMRGGHPQLKQAVVLSMPLLFRAVTRYWNLLLSTPVADRLVLLLSNLFDYFNSAPNWYTSIVLSQLLVCYLPRLQQLMDIFDKLLPFLEHSTHGTNLQLLSLTSPFITVLLVRGKHQLPLTMLSSLQRQLANMDPSLLSSYPAQLSVLHLACGITSSFAAGLLSEDMVMSSITQLADIATKGYNEAVLQLSFGIALHGLSSYGHRRVHTLAENVAAKWLQELRDKDEGELSGGEVEPVIAGLAGLVGVDPVMCGRWESMCAVASHKEMMRTLGYLVVDSMEKITSCHDSSVTSYKDIHSLAMWLLTQTVLHVTDLIVYSERVPMDYSYLPMTSALRSTLQLCQALTSKSESDCTHHPILTSLLCGLHSLTLPPANFSSILLPSLMHGSGTELQQACITSITKSKDGQGFRDIIIYCTLPAIFPSLQGESQHMLLESLPLLLNSLCSVDHYHSYLQEMTAMILEDLLIQENSFSCFLKGVGKVLSADTKEHSATVMSVVTIYKATCNAMSNLCEKSSLCVGAMKLLHNESIWKELAFCLTFGPSEVVQVNAKSLVPTEGACHVGLAVQCSQVTSGFKPFKTLATSINWFLDHLTGNSERVHGILLSPLITLLNTIHSSCSPQLSKNHLLHQTELLYMLSAWTKDNKEMISVKQWRAVLLFSVTGCIPTGGGFHGWISSIETESEMSLRLDYLLMSDVCMVTPPTEPVIRDKLCYCLLEWLGATECGVIRRLILGYFAILKSCDEYKKGINWTTVAHLL